MGQIYWPLGCCSGAKTANRSSVLDPGGSTYASSCSHTDCIPGWLCLWRIVISGFLISLLLDQMSENNEDKPTAAFSSLNYRAQLLKSYELSGSIQLPPPLLPQQDNVSTLGSISVSAIALTSSEWLNYLLFLLWQPPFSSI